ncbi:hypothetical protein C8046_04325 [Serinibacter arcticus]|uniref:DUF222 domain-containing protein n=1 Tax=Serinibacter arcticus TaxID=1655435 RepID=A0A2U1ZSR0_9MICO|nr:DUF222 domain-containing protein [Serinibacter arcticus]PWD50016.1 hypothetical protein C8046_04325 [Serinibacter arcticus]
MFESVTLGGPGFLDEDPAAVRARLGLSAPDDGGAPTALIERLLQLSDYPDLRRLNDSELIELVAAHAALESWAAASQREAAAVLQSRHDRADTDRRRPGRVEITGSAADDLAMRLGISRGRAGRLVGEGQLFADVLNPVGSALAEGRIDPGKASAFADLLLEEPAPVCFAVCEQVLPEAPGLAHAALRRRIRDVIVQVDPRTAGERAAIAATRRRVEPVRLLPDGQASLRYVAPLPDVLAVFTMTEAAARAARADGDSRTLPQLRADALAAAALEVLAAGRIGGGSGGGGAFSGTSGAGGGAGSGGGVRGSGGGGTAPVAGPGAGATGAEAPLADAMRTVSPGAAPIGPGRSESHGFVPFSGATSLVTLALTARHLDPESDEAMCAADLVAWEVSPATPSADAAARDQEWTATDPDLAAGTAHPGIVSGEAFSAYEAPTTCRPGVDVPELLGFGPSLPRRREPWSRRHLRS